MPQASPLNSRPATCAGKLCKQAHMQQAHRGNLLTRSTCAGLLVARSRMSHAACPSGRAPARLLAQSEVEGDARM